MEHYPDRFCILWPSSFISKVASEVSLKMCHFFHGHVLPFTRLLWYCFFCCFSPSPPPPPPPPLPFLPPAPGYVGIVVQFKKSCMLPLGPEALLMTTKNILAPQSSPWSTGSRRKMQKCKTLVHSKCLLYSISLKTLVTRHRLNTMCLPDGRERGGGLGEKDLKRHKI